MPETVTAVEAFGTLLTRLGTFGFGTLMGLILVGSYYGVWIWGKTHERDMAAAKQRYDEDIVEWKTRLREKSEECEKWQSAYLRAATHTDKMIDLTVKPSSQFPPG